MTDLEVVNRALTFLGGLPATSMADTAKNAARAISAYPLLRDETLRMAEWPSCTTRALLKGMHEQACPWAATKPYLIDDRVTNDTAKTYQCTVAGVSAGSGGPTGTDTAITDGTVTWTYVEASTALNNWAHQALTAYVVGDLVTADSGRVYECVTAGTTAAASAPSGTTAGQADGTVVWDHYETPAHNRTVYLYQYVLPPDCLRVLKIPSLTASKESDQGEQYLREGRMLYCDIEDAAARYIRRADPDLWDPLLVKTVALAIAAEIVFDVTGKEQLTILIHQKLAAAYEDAKVIALNEGAEGPPETAWWS